MRIQLESASCGWSAETLTELDQRRVLVNRTARASRNLSNLVTRATVSTRLEDGELIYDIGGDARLGDFDQLVASTPCTQNSHLTKVLVLEQHDKALGTLPDLRTRITQHYRQFRHWNARRAARNRGHTMAEIERLAQEVVNRWDKGDLAEAVRALSQHLESLKSERLAYRHHIAAAEQLHCDEDVQVDDDATVSPTDDGCWVSAWLKVRDEDVQETEHG